jgi:hypothetical protein
VDVSAACAKLGENVCGHSQTSAWLEVSDMTHCDAHPASNGEKNFHMAMLLFQQVQLFETAVHVRANIIPRVTFPMDL